MIPPGSGAAAAEAGAAAAEAGAVAAEAGAAASTLRAWCDIGGSGGGGFRGGG